MIGRYVTGSCVDVVEASLEGLKYVFRNVLGLRRRQIIIKVTRTAKGSLGLQFRTICFQFQTQGSETMGS